jgi:hypothetical protein
MSRLPQLTMCRPDSSFVAGLMYLNFKHVLGSFIV